MHINGNLFQIMPAQTGNGKNGPWKKCEFILETQEKYPKKICFSAWNDQAEEVAHFSPGTSLEVHFDLSSREYNGRWYNDIKAWKILASGSGGTSGSGSGNYSGGNQNTGSSQAYSAPAQPAQPLENDDLPF